MQEKCNLLYEPVCQNTVVPTTQELLSADQLHAIPNAVKDLEGTIFGFPSRSFSYYFFIDDINVKNFL